MSRTFRRRMQRGFNLIELLVALSITATLMVATMVAIRASFMAYQSTTEVASTNTIARLAMHRILTLIRTGQDFGPFPTDPNDPLIESEEILIVTRDLDQIRITWIPDPPTPGFPVGNALYVEVNGGPAILLLGGVVPTVDPVLGPIKPFALEYLAGRQLYRVTIDLTIVPDDDMSVTLDGVNTQTIRLVASTMPRITAYKTDF